MIFDSDTKTWSKWSAQDQEFRFWTWTGMLSSCSKQRVWKKLGIVVPSRMEQIDRRTNHLVSSSDRNGKKPCHSSSRKQSSLPSFSMDSNPLFLYRIQYPHCGIPLEEFLLSLSSSSSSWRTLNPDLIHSLLHHFWKIHQELNRHEIVHNDIHLRNIVILSSSSLSLPSTTTLKREPPFFYLIDFERASYPGMSLSKEEKKDVLLHSLYWWSREDLYRYLMILLHRFPKTPRSTSSSSNPDTRIKSKEEEDDFFLRSDFRQERKRWRLYFRSNPPETWIHFQKRYSSWFLPLPQSSRKRPSSSLLPSFSMYHHRTTFLSQILLESPLFSKQSSRPCPSSSSSFVEQWIEQCTTKVFLERFSLLFFLFCTNGPREKTDRWIFQSIRHWISSYVTERGG